MSGLISLKKYKNHHNLKKPSKIENYGRGKKRALMMEITQTTNTKKSTNKRCTNDPFRPNAKVDSEAKHK